MRKIYFTRIIFFILILFVNSERPIGEYIDNEFDQTIFHKVANEKQQQMEQELFNIFELSDKPKKISSKPLTMERSVSKFLLGIYKNVSSNSTYTRIQEESENTKEFNLNDRYINIIDESDSIITFRALNWHSRKASKTNRDKRIWFDMSKVPKDKNIITAELLLYQNSNKTSKLNKSYTITAYRVDRKNGRRTKLYIDSINITGEKGWIALNISKAFKHWINHPRENKGLFLSVRNYTNYTLRPDDIGIVGVLGIPDKQPFMVSFFKSPTTFKQKIPSKRKRDVKEQYLSSMKNEINPYVNSLNRKGKQNACNIRTLYVSFKDLRLHDWIIAPKGYNAHYCSGECNFPLDVRMNATSHAIVQTLMNLIKPHEIPKPCCVPTKLSPISLIHYVDDSRIVLNMYKNMVVDSCGCH